MKAASVRVLGVIAVLTAPVHSLATDSKITPGIMCQPSNGAEMGNINYGVDGDINTQDGDFNVTCAVIHDDVTGSIQDLEVNTDPISGAGNEIECQGWATNRTGSSFSFTSSLDTDGTGNAQVIDFGSLSGFTRGSYFVECTVPQSGEIISIDAEETT